MVHFVISRMVHGLKIGPMHCDRAMGHDEQQVQLVVLTGAPI